MVLYSSSMTFVVVVVVVVAQRLQLLSKMLTHCRSFLCLFVGLNSCVVVQMRAFAGTLPSYLLG